MTDQRWLPAVTINGNLSLPAGIERYRGFLLPLSNLDGEKSNSYVLWHHPADTEFMVPNALEHYLQCAGSAERLTLELRQTNDDGSHTHWVLGRGPLTGTPSESIRWANSSTIVHPEEVWTAEQAAPLFEQYSAMRAIPDWVHRRVFDI